MSGGEGGRDQKHIRKNVRKKVYVFHLRKFFSSKLELNCFDQHSLTSSRSVGRILRVRRPSENLSNTLLRPFIKDIFSSRDLVLKLDRSRKFSVDIGSDEKNGWEGSVVGVGRCCDPRVTSDRSKAIEQRKSRLLELGRLIWFPYIEDRDQVGPFQ